MFRKTVFALLITVYVAACVSADDPNKKAKQGAAVGAAAGAVAGAVIGNQGGNNRTGAVIGGAVGAGIGAAIGHRMDQQQRELQQIPGVEVQRTAPDQLNVVLGNDILFDTGSAALRTESRTALRDLANVFVKYPDQTIAVSGHTDNVGGTSYNQNLSEERASSVRNYLVDQGIPSSRIVARGYGETTPKASNSTAEGRQLNRRVEIHVTANPSA